MSAQPTRSQATAGQASSSGPRALGAGVRPRPRGLATPLDARLIVDDEDAHRVLHGAERQDSTQGIDVGHQTREDANDDGDLRGESTGNGHGSCRSAPST